MNKKPQPGEPQYWTFSTTPPETPALQGLRWLYDCYCRRMWATVDQAIAQAVSELPVPLKECLHQTLSHQERKALKSHVLWLLIEQTGVTVDLELNSEDILDRTDLIRAAIRLDAMQKVLQAEA